MMSMSFKRLIQAGPMLTGAAALLCWLSAGPALADDTNRYGPEYQACDQDQTIQIVSCLKDQTAAWDKRLNSAYKAALALQSPDQRAALQKAQRLWIQYRDANCGFYAGGEGTISQIAAAECMRSMTQDRAIELKEAGPQQ